MHTAVLPTDSPKARVQREKAFAEAAQKGWLVGAAHIAFPGMGHLRKGAGKGYAWVPVNYSSLK
jgi:hypothetical protein